MPRKFSSAVLTANDLTGGCSVFLSAEGWDRSIAKAMVAVTPEQAEELSALGERHVKSNDVVGPYLVDVEIAQGTPRPVLRREQIRADGVPTIPVGREIAMPRAA
ncbi:MAG: DUF2849 domain-containing protein [Pseudomonadota bacterium]